MEITIAQLASYLLFFYAGLIGAVLGSFANVCIVRIPRNESIVRPRSHCRSCGHRIRWWENIPVLSFLLLRGRCRACRKPIGVQYFIVECLGIGLSLLAWWYFAEPLRYFLYLGCLLIPLLIVTFIDLEHYIIPDSISLPGIICGFLIHVLVEGKHAYGAAALDAVLGIVLGGGTLYLVAAAYERIRKQEGLGGGDIKLIAMLGAFFGWKAVLLILLISSFLGTLVGIILLILFRRRPSSAIPYGPFLSAAGVLYLFWGERLIAWYFGLFS